LCCSMCSGTFRTKTAFSFRQDICNRCWNVWPRRKESTSGRLERRNDRPRHRRKEIGGERARAPMRLASVATSVNGMSPAAAC
jgi:hypothetical protein